MRHAGNDHTESDAVSIDKIRFRCPGCNRKLGADPRNVGALARCPRCNARTTVPHPADPRALPPKQGPPQPPRSGVLRSPGLPPQPGASHPAPGAQSLWSTPPPPGVPGTAETKESTPGAKVLRLAIAAAVAAAVCILLWVFLWR
jgi:hypothetical protein